MPHVEATIFIGCAKRDDAFIPKIRIIPVDLPFKCR
jgi:hypothetical protein